MKAVIMAGGAGTRIRSVASDIPKSMIPVLGKPVLEYQIDALKESGITDITLVIGRLGECISTYFGDGSEFGVHITYYSEPFPMGSAGALYHIREDLGEDILLLMGDLMLSVDFKRFIEAHLSSGGLATLFVHPNSHPYDSYIIVTDEAGKAEDFTEEIYGPAAPPFAAGAAAPRAARVVSFISGKEKREAPYHNLVNSGIYALSREALFMVPEPDGTKVDIDADVIRPMIPGGRVFAYRSAEYVKDMGTPARYDEVIHAVQAGIVRKRNLAGKQKCIFLDRDGTINVLKGFLTDPDELELIEGAAGAIKRINESEYLAVLVTNQPIMARGDVTFEEYDRIQKQLETLLGAQGACLDASYYCPHHPDSGFEGEVRSLKFRCRCRKPGTGMLEKAAADLNIDIASSYMIGDMTADIAAGNRAGTGTIALRTGFALGDGLHECSPDCTADDLSEAVDMILGSEG